jgi:hypothetical protein
MYSKIHVLSEYCSCCVSLSTLSVHNSLNTYIVLRRHSSRNSREASSDPCIESIQINPF